MWRATLGMNTARGAKVFRRYTPEKRPISSAVTMQAKAFLGRQRRGEKFSLIGKSGSGGGPPKSHTPPIGHVV